MSMSFLTSLMPLGFQLKELSASMHEILIDDETKSEDLLSSVVNLLISAAYFQVCAAKWHNVFLQFHGNCKDFL